MKDALAELVIAKIRVDGGTQMRAEIDEDTVDEYVEVLASLPPITVFYDGNSYWIVDGFHRLRAHEKARKKVIYAEVKSGTQRDAILYAAGANGRHGRRRTHADKRRAVGALLRDPEWTEWSNRKLADQCGVTEFLVRTMKSEREGAIKSHPKPEPMSTAEFRAADERTRIKEIQREEAAGEERAARREEECARTCVHEWICAKCGEAR